VYVSIGVWQIFEQHNDSAVDAVQATETAESKVINPSPLSKSTAVASPA
jgi:hypothetical protein